MSFAGNVLWFVCGGWFWGTVYLLMGCLACCTVVGIPFGMATFRLACFVYFPFGRELVDAADLGEKPIPGTEIAAFCWVVLVGTFSAVGFVFSGILCCCSVIGIPFGMAYFRLAKAVFNPLGKRAVPTALAETVRVRKANQALDAAAEGKGPARMGWALKPHLILAIVLSVPVNGFLISLPGRILSGASRTSVSHGNPQRGQGEERRPAAVASKPLDKRSAAELEEVRTAVGRALGKVVPTLGLTGLTVISPAEGQEGAYRVTVAYTEPLYAIGARLNRWEDETRGLSFAVRGGGWRGIRLVAAAGTPVPSTLWWRSPTQWRLEAAAAKETAFPSSFAKAFPDAALFVEGSGAERQLRQVLERLLALSAQVEADLAVRRSDPVAAARLKRNQKALRDASSTLGAFLGARGGRVVEQLPEAWLKPFGELPGEAAAKARNEVDIPSLLKEVNRRMAIAGHSAEVVEGEMLERSESERSVVYRLRVKLSQATYTLGPQSSSRVSEANRNVRVAGLPSWRVVTLRHRAGEWFEADLQMSRPGTRDSDGFALEEHGASGMALPDDVWTKGKGDVLLLAGSPAAEAWETTVGRALVLSQAIHEDAALRRNDPAAKGRYEANRKALASFQKELRAYAKGRVGTISETLPGLLMAPSPKR